MLRWGLQRVGRSRRILQRDGALPQQARGRHVQFRGFCDSPASSSSSPAEAFPPPGEPASTEGRWTQQGEGEGISQAAVQRRSLRKANNRPLSELERACIQMLWRRSPSEPIEVTLHKAQFPLTAANLSLVLAHLRSAKEALRIFLCFIRANPSFVPEKVLVDALGRFWRHERERFPAFIGILNDLRSPSCQMTPRKLTTLLRGYGWAGLVDEVLHYLSTCEASYGFKPDFVHYSCALHTCITEKRIDVAVQIFEQMKKNGCPPTTDTFQSLISGLLHARQAVEAAALFEQMYVSKLVKPNELPSRVVSYISVVNELLCLEDLRHASSFLLRMNVLGFVPDYFTCAKVLNAYPTRGLLQEQHELFLDFKAKGMVPDVDGLRKFFKEHNINNLMPEAQALLNSLLNILESASKVKDLEKASSDDNAHASTEVTMAAGNCDPSPSCTRSDAGIEKADILIFDRIIYGLSVQEKSEDAFELMLRLVEGRDLTIIPGANTSAVLFDALCRDFSWEKAERCLRMMMKWGHMPEVKVYNVWVQGSAKGGGLENVSDFMNEFPNDNLTLDAISHNLLVEKFCMAGKLDEAKKVTRDVKKNENGTPDVLSYSRMIQSFAKAGDFNVPRKLLDEMVQMGITPYALPFMPLVRRLCLSGKVDEALAFVEEIEGKGCKPLPGLYTPIVSAFCKANRLQDAFNVMDIMKAKGVTPEPQTHKDLFGSCMGTRTLKPAVQAA